MIRDARDRGLPTLTLPANSLIFVQEGFLKMASAIEMGIRVILTCLEFPRRSALTEDTHDERTGTTLLRRGLEVVRDERNVSTLATEMALTGGERGCLNATLTIDFLTRQLQDRTDQF
jgi:hypothetical protein